ncbi:response regulator [Marinobacter bohaiensis]|uniref:response regulator n=1 Tax=Marinobacter bohaiensis TaxID=2201898 RepID=UPI000DACDE2F|nr:response regulator transcription factor [Marinobacter bohaiensis]
MTAVTHSVLVVDDDEDICELLQTFLGKAGYHVRMAADGDAMRAAMDECLPDVLILDIMLPGDDGFTLCRWVRDHFALPIIMLTASSDEADKVIGLELGADDYIAKPFSARELQARIKALLRRSQLSQQGFRRYVRFGQWRLDCQTHELNDQHGERIALSGADFALLKLFVDHANSILDRDTIAGVTRGREADPLDRVVDVAVSRLRHRLGDKGRDPKLIRTVRGAGYMLTATISYENE